MCRGRVQKPSDLAAVWLAGVSTCFQIVSPHLMWGPVAFPPPQTLIVSLPCTIQAPQVAEVKEPNGTTSLVYGLSCSFLELLRRRDSRARREYSRNSPENEPEKKTAAQRGRQNGKNLALKSVGLSRVLAQFIAWWALKRVCTAGNDDIYVCAHVYKSIKLRG